MDTNKRRNYTELEIETFVSSLETFKDIIECKISNKMTNTQKLQAWRELTDYYNSMPGICKSTLKQLQDLPKNLKRKAAKNNASERLEKFETCGGQYETFTSQTDQRLIAMGSVKKPLINLYDSDHVYYMKTSMCKC